MSKPVSKLIIQGRRTAAYARRAEAVAAASQVATIAVLPPTKASTVREVMDAYVAELARRGGDAGSVASAVQCWIGPALGDLAPHECDAARVALLVGAMQSVGRADNTVRARCSHIKSAMSFALRARLIDPPHPLPSLRGVVPQKRNRPGYAARREVLSISQLERLVSSPRVPERERCMYLVAATTGLRIAELLELRDSDIDRDAPDCVALYVHRQWRRKRKNVGPPKGGGSRVVILRADVLRVLDRWRELGWQRAYGRSIDRGDLLFPADRADRHQDDRKTLKRLHRFLARVGLGPRNQHAFRHTFVSFLIDAGVRKDVAEQFTHPAPWASIDVYAHYSFRVLREAAHAIPLRLREVTEQLELFPEEEDR